MNSTLAVSAIYLSEYVAVTKAGYATAGGLGADQVQLVLGAVDQDDPGAPVAGVTGPGLVVGFSPAVSRVRIFPSRAAAFAVPARSAPGRTTIPLQSADRTSSVIRQHVRLGPGSGLPPPEFLDQRVHLGLLRLDTTVEDQLPISWLSSKAPGQKSLQKNCAQFLSWAGP
jgi:hypothetical protein